MLRATGQLLSICNLACSEAVGGSFLFQGRRHGLSLAELRTVASKLTT